MIYKSYSMSLHYLYRWALYGWSLNKTWLKWGKYIKYKEKSDGRFQILVLNHEFLVILIYYLISVICVSWFRSLLSSIYLYIPYQCSAYHVVLEMFLHIFAFNVTCSCEWNTWMRWRRKSALALICEAIRAIIDTEN